MPQFARPATRNAPTIHQSFVRSWRRMPSSTAYFARNGGASAVAVAASSEKTERVVRVLYGAVSRASVASRRRVRAQDQSSTSVPNPCRNAASGRRLQRLPATARLDRRGELALEQAVLVDFAVDGARL